MVARPTERLEPGVDPGVPTTPEGEDPIRRPWIVWLILALTFVHGGFLAFDGAHALFSGDYLTPDSGPHAGQLGPWSRVPEALGLDPRGGVVVGFFLVTGSAWLITMIAFASGRRGSREAMMFFALITIWYFPFGTILNVIALTLLLLPAVGRHYDDAIP